MEASSILFFESGLMAATFRGLGNVPDWSELFITCLKSVWTEFTIVLKKSDGIVSRQHVDGFRCCTVTSMVFWSTVLNSDIAVELFLGGLRDCIMLLFCWFVLIFNLMDWIFSLKKQANSLHYSICSSHLHNHLLNNAVKTVQKRKQVHRQCVFWADGVKQKMSMSKWTCQQLDKTKSRK